MAASVQFGEALVLGLASGPACIAACGPVIVPSLLTERAGLQANAQFLLVFLGARLVGYLLFAIGAWELGALASMLPGSRMHMSGVIYVMLACSLIWYAYSARRMCSPSCSGSRLVNIGETKSRGAGGASVLGLLTGFSLCPPFVVAGIRAAQLSSVAQAVLFFSIFFVGTSVWFVPLAGLSCVTRNEAVVTVARIAMVLIAIYYGSMGIVMMLGGKGNGH